VTAGATEGYAVPGQPVISVVILLNDMIVMKYRNVAGHQHT